MVSSDMRHRLREIPHHYVEVIESRATEPGSRRGEHAIRSYPEVDSNFGPDDPLGNEAPELGAKKKPPPRGRSRWVVNRAVPGLQKRSKRCPSRNSTNRCFLGASGTVHPAVTSKATDAGRGNRRQGVVRWFAASGLGSITCYLGPTPNLPVSRAGNTLNRCPQCSESVAFVSTFTRTRVPSLRTFTFAAQTASASSGWIRSRWHGIVA